MSEPLKIVIITGVSGAGKTVALRVLEDTGFYCVDNLPLPMVHDFVETMKKEPRIDRIAFVVDVRFQQYIERYATVPAALAFSGQPTEILYLDASDDVLVPRFSFTRRKHPLGDSDLPSAFSEERALLAPLRAQATTFIDTSELNIHQLKQIIQQRYGEDEAARLIVSCVSFGFRYGIPRHADLLFDVRFLPNPFFVKELSNGTGMDPEVAGYVMKHPDATEFLNKTKALLNFLLPRYHSASRVYLTVAIGCTGGQHRSVAIAEALAPQLAHTMAVNVKHRDISKAQDRGDGG